MRITPEYLAMNQEMHRTKPSYGTSGAAWVKTVNTLAAGYQCESIIDYGCGKAMLSQYLRRVCPIKVQNYDPAVPEFAARPHSADLVVCTDVMEHVEPLCTDSVLLDIREMMNKVAFFNISTRPAVKHLPDGRNAHINLRAPYEWFDIMRIHFNIVRFDVQPGSVTFIVEERTHD